MEENVSTTIVRNIMLEFAELTGLASARKAPQRYLWTDAFALCNFLELYSQTSDEQYKQPALRLVDQVHRVLGRHRDDDPRNGWISGLDEREGELHPTRGGLHGSWYSNSSSEYQTGAAVSSRAGSAAFAYSVFTDIFFLASTAAAVFGSVIVSTPFLKLAETLSVAT